MGTLITLPWRWTGPSRPDQAVLFASRFDGAGLRAGWELFRRGLRLRRAVLRSSGALGVSVRSHPLKGHYYTLSLWADEASLHAFARSDEHREAIRRIGTLAPVRGVLVSRANDARRKPGWADTLRWVDASEPGPYRHLGTTVG